MSTTSDKSPPAAAPAATGESPAHVSPLLTRAEAINYLRINVAGVKFPDEAFRQFARRTGLRGVKVSRIILYLKEDLDAAIIAARDRVAC